MVTVGVFGVPSIFINSIAQIFFMLTR